MKIYAYDHLITNPNITIYNFFLKSDRGEKLSEKHPVNIYFVPDYTIFPDVKDCVIEYKIIVETCENKIIIFNMNSNMDIYKTMLINGVTVTVVKNIREGI